MYSFPLPYLSFLAHFHESHDYFECHEVLEEYWKEKTDQSRDSVWVGLIQTAVSLYHHRRGNFAGAQKMAAKALKILQSRTGELAGLGIDSEAFLRQLSCRLQEITEGKAFAEMAIPFLDKEVVLQYRSFHQSCTPSILEKDAAYLRNKHLLRDRSPILDAREQALKQRHGQTADQSANL
ncbi:DUF309 domain-containing protein [Pseudobacillus badius]|uniref:DUF309 domain-containing protein n=1 Tax=Bacillus badius TaxID=1455 RepID=UPI0007B3B5DA|nr:DUF309 domain-containing protein [Bacillus badius]KZR60283.1 hypothetical protein A3781_08860 [Bacillus badius]